MNTVQSAIEDCNLAVTNGLWYTNPSTLNAPVTGYGYIRVSVFGGYVYQLFTSLASDKTMAYRVFSGTEASNWSRLDNFGYNTLAELAAALKPLMQ